MSLGSWGGLSSSSNHQRSGPFTTTTAGPAGSRSPAGGGGGGGAGGTHPSTSSSASYYNYGEDEIIEQLNTNDFELRLRVLNRLRSVVHQAGQSGGGGQAWFAKFRKKADLFKAFAKVLSDKNWEVQHQCIKFLGDTIQYYGTDLEWTMELVMSELVGKLASTKITVRRVTVQCLITYLRESDNVAGFLKTLVRQCLSKGDGETKEVLKEVGSLFVPDLAGKNWFDLVDGCTRLLLETSEAETQALSLSVLDKLFELVGRSDFNGYISRLPDKQKAKYEIHLMQQQGGPRHQLNPSVNSTKRNSFEERNETRASTNAANSSSGGGGGGGKQYRYAVVPIPVYELITNEDEARIRCSGLEQLKIIIQGLSQSDMHRMSQHLFSYLNWLSNALDDLNIKVVVSTLDILRVTVGKMGMGMEPHVSQVTKIIGKHLGNQKSVVKQLNMMIVMDLSTYLQPKPIMAPLSNYLQHRNSRTLNMITAAVLKFPSNAFNLPALAHASAPSLADPKRRVRLASFELLSVLAQAMGPGKQEPLLRCVRYIESERSAPGLMEAVQARLARHQLPKIRYDGLIEYSLPTTPIDGSRAAAHSSPNTKDFEWIMEGGVGPGSALARNMTITGSSSTQSTPMAPLRGLSPSLDQLHLQSNYNLSSINNSNTADLRNSNNKPRSADQHHHKAAYRTTSHSRLEKLPWEQQSTTTAASDSRNNSAPPVPAAVSSPLTRSTNSGFGGSGAAYGSSQSYFEAQRSNSAQDPRSSDVGGGYGGLGFGGLGRKSDSASPPPMVQKSSSWQSNHNSNSSTNNNNNSKRVLSPISASARSFPAYDGERSPSPVDENELAKSVDWVKYTAMQRREEMQRRQSSQPAAAAAGAANNRLNPGKPAGATGLMRAHSESQLHAADSPASESPWDDRPLNSSKTNGYSQVEHSPRPSPRRQSLAINNNSKPKPKQTTAHPHRFASAETAETTLSISPPPPPPSSQPPPKRLSKPPLKRRQSLPKTKKAPTGPNRVSSNASKADGSSKDKKSSSPEAQLETAMKKICKEEWTEKVEGINTMQELSSSHTKLIGSQLHEIVKLLNVEAKNLRSSVSRVAITCLGHLFIHYKKTMDSEIDKVCSVLMQKTGDPSSAFIRDDSLQALEMMVDNVTPTKSINALITSGAKAKSVTIRSACAQLLQRMAENMGSQVMSDPNVGDKLIANAAAFATDKEPQPRHFGKATLQMLSNEDPALFEKTCNRALSAGQRDSVKDFMGKANLNASQSSRGGLSNGGSGGAAAGRSPALSRKGSQRKAGGGGKVSEQVQDRLESCRKKLASSQWEERVDGLDEFADLAKANPKVLTNNVKLVETFMGRLNDINSKVAIKAFDAYNSSMIKLGPLFKESGLKAILADMLKNIGAQLPSKNAELRSLAQSGLDTAVKHIDQTILIMPFAQAAKSGNAKQKPDLLSRLSKINQSVHGMKPKMVESHGVPVAWDLLKSTSGDNACKRASAEYVRSLAKLLGKKQFLDLANSTQKTQIEAVL